MYGSNNRRAGTVSKIENRVLDNQVLSSKLMYDLDKLPLYYVIVPDDIAENRFDLLAEFIYEDINYFQYLAYFCPNGFRRGDVIKIPKKADIDSIL